jgi:hypothetical protein
LKNYSNKTEQAYVNWIKQYIFFYDKNHPQDMGAFEIEAFLTHLAVDRNVASSTKKPSLKCHPILVSRSTQSNRISMLLESLLEPFHTHLIAVEDLHQQDLREGFGRVALPFVLSRNTRMQIGNGFGNMFSHLKYDRKEKWTASFVAIISTLLPYIKRFAKQPGLLKSINMLPRVPSATPSPPICSKGDTISAPSRNCWGIKCKNHDDYTHVLNRGPNTVRSSLDSMI